jgi:hypothetical protein
MSTNKFTESLRGENAAVVFVDHLGLAGGQTNSGADANVCASLRSGSASSKA